MDCHPQIAASDVEDTGLDAERHAIPIFWRGALPEFSNRPIPAGLTR